MPIETFEIKKHYRKELDSGNFIINKPIAFPKEKGELKPQSKLFHIGNYFSEFRRNVDSNEHKAFEIIQFVAKGSIEHHDSFIKEKRIIRSGHIALMQCNSGMTHRDTLNEETQLIQIWLDPNIQETLFLPPFADTYDSENFTLDKVGRARINNIAGGGSDVKLQTKNVRIRDFNLYSCNENISFLETNINFGYVYKGEGEINNHIVNENDFIIVKNERRLNFSVPRDCKILFVEMPENAPYNTYAEINSELYQ